MVGGCAWAGGCPARPCSVPRGLIARHRLPRSPVALQGQVNRVPPSPDASALLLRRPKIQATMPRDPFAWALVGPGRIAHRFAEAVTAWPGSRLHRVLGRDAGRAAAFAARWSLPGQPAVGVADDLPALLADPEVQAVYVATPHAGHAGVVRQCLLAGKPVLCEKPLAPTLAQARDLVALARSRRVFLMEALWTRLLPLYRGLRPRLDEGVIGAVRAVQSSFCFAAPFDAHSRLFDPALAGGALLDIGIYNLALTRWALEPTPGRCPEPTAIDVQGVLAPTGVDQRVTGQLHFPGGVVSQFVCAFDTCADNSLRLCGEAGVITVPGGFWGATEAVLQAQGQPAQTLQAPFRINGFEEQIEEVQRCVRAGLIESPHIPHAETLGLMGWIDTLLQRLGVRYPFD